MRTKSLNRLGREVFYLVSLAVCLESAPVWATPLKEWQYNPTSNQLEVTLKDGVKPRYFLMARPARIVLELPNTEVGTVPRQQTYEGAVRQVRVSQVKPGLTRIVLELSPDATLLRGQANLQRVGDAAPSTSDRWVLRPLFAQATNPSAPTLGLPPTPISQAPPVVYPPGIAPPTSEVSGAQSSDRAIPDAQDKPIDIVVPRPTTPSLSTNPPPTAVPLVVAASAPKIAAAPTPPSPENFPPGIAPSLEPPVSEPAAPQRSNSSRESAINIAQKPAARLQLPDINSSLAIPESLPPVTMPNPAIAAPTVSVPPLNSTRGTIAPDLPPAATFNSPAAVTVPPLRTTAPAMSAEQPARSSRQVSQIEFGQPLPTQSRPQQPNPISYNPGALLPAGTVLSLRYSGGKALPLQPDQPRQEVLVLQNGLRDRAGSLIAPEGTEVLGKFETSGSGSRFVAQTILLPGKNVAIAAQSGWLGGDRKVSDNRLIRNSSIGALAGAILGGLSGGNVVGGAAAGAAVTYATAPKFSTIQPGQILEVRLTEDLMPI